jgi:hypothetical protein
MRLGSEPMRTEGIAWRLSALAGLLAFGLCVGQHRAIVRLQVQLADMRQARSELTHLQEENRKLARDQLNEADRAALQQAVAAANASRQKISPLTQPPQGIAAALKPGELLPASAWTFVGRATPKDVLESILWSSMHGDVDRLSALFQFDPAARDKAQAFFAQLPEATRAQYGDAVKVFATMLAGNMPTDIGAMGVVATPSSEDSADSAKVLIRLQRESGLNKDVYFNFQKDADGWQLVMPRDIVVAYAEQLASGSVPLATTPGRLSLTPVQAAVDP